MRRILLSLGAAATALTLAACGNNSSSDHTSHATATTAAPATADHVDADVSFTQNMIAHHGQAIDMSELATVRASNLQVKALATRIQAAQGPEITTMTGWLRSWDQPTTTTMAGSSMPGMAMNHTMPGMMSGHDMATLQSLNGAAFDRQFLTMMIDHHNGALEMAKTEQTSGRYQPATQLASSIVTSQSAQIAEMQNLLKVV